MLGIFALFGMVSVGLAVASLADDDDSSQDGDVSDQPDDPVELIGEAGVVDFLEGGSGNDTLTGNRDDADVLIGGGGNDLFNLEEGNTATGGEGEDLFLIDAGYSWGEDDAPIQLTDFDPTEDQLVLEFDQADVDIRPLEDEAGLGVYSEGGHLILALPGVTELQEGAVTFATELQADFSEDRGIEFAVSLISGADITVVDPAEGNPYSFVVADSGDTTISVSADASIIQGGAGDDFIEVVGDGENPLPEVDTFGTSHLHELLDHGVPPIGALHHNLFGGAGADTISVHDASAFIRTSDDSEGDLVQLSGEVTALVEAGPNDTVIGSDDALVTQVLLHGDGGRFEGGEASEIAAALGDSTLIGGGGHDVLLGSDGAQNLSGGQGDDYLNPNDNRVPSHHSSSVYENMDDQSDTLDGGAGNDVLVLSNGDVATGGSGSDSFSAYLDVEHELGGATLSDFDPENETIRIYLSGGEFMDESSIFTGETYDLRGRVEEVETPDGNTRILVDGSDIMELTGQTGLNIGFEHTFENNETVWYDLEGNESDPADLAVLISVHENYHG